MFDIKKHLEIDNSIFEYANQSFFRYYQLNCDLSFYLQSYMILDKRAFTVSLS